jgi:hypothetical protein
VRGYRSYRPRTAVAALQTLAVLPSLHGTSIHSGDLAGRPQSSSCTPGLLDILCCDQAIFQADHSSSPRRTIASIRFDGTNNAAASASTLSFRLKSRSSSLMRFLILASLLRTASLLDGFRQGKRAHDTRLTRDTRHSAAPRPSLQSQSPPPVGPLLSISCETVAIAALSGGSRRATARCLNLSPCRATSSPSAPQAYRPIEAATNVT